MSKRSITFGLIAASAIALSVFSFVPRVRAVAATNPAATAGEKVYSANCSACHGANGTGQSGVFPPLAGNSMVTGSPDKVIAAVKDGLTGAVTVGGKTYSGAMPAWNGKLSNADIADVITYVRSAWGNNASAVTEAQVEGVK